MWTDFVDELFIINMQVREDRLKETIAELERHHIKANVFLAQYKRNGVEGLRNTMEYLLQYCIDNRYERVCLFEDDIKIMQPNFNELALYCTMQLPDYFDLFYFGANLWRKPVKFSSNLMVGTSMYSTHAIIYSRKAMEFILAKIKQLTIPYDALLVDTIQQYGRCFCAYPLLMSQRSGYSDIKKKVVNYDKYIEKRYEERTNGVMNDS